MWFHVSSLGELEQAIPVMQAYRALHPDTSWLLTVYSPSAWHPLQAKGVATVVEGGEKAMSSRCFRTIFRERGGRGWKP